MVWCGLGWVGFEFGGFRFGGVTMGSEGQRWEAGALLCGELERSKPRILLVGATLGADLVGRSSEWVKLSDVL